MKCIFKSCLNYEVMHAIKGAYAVFIPEACPLYEKRVRNVLDFTPMFFVDFFPLSHNEILFLNCIDCSQLSNKSQMVNNKLEMEKLFSIF